MERREDVRRGGRRNKEMEIGGKKNKMKKEK